jgi:AraC family transcriptional regulator of adaptative response / DNA-3-methyladenine glycosylase II
MRQPSRVSAVTTTGIYCRAGCPGRPKGRNVLGFDTSVAAEAAGFRPCLRCRPDRLPPVSTVDGGPGVIERALLLISEGTLDNGREEELAARLHMSARQLRRLFLQHLGATPSFVARSRRAHFARRLLDESDMAMTRIAFAAGFSSVRQMNRVVRDTFHLTPSALRKRRFRSDRLVADGGLPLRLPYEGPLAFDAMLAFLRPRAIPGVEAVGPDTYRRSITTCGNPGAIELRDASDGRHLILLAHLPTYDALIDDVARSRRIFALDRNPETWLPTLLRDPMLAPLIAAAPGLRPPGAWDRFEVAVRVIIGQGISVATATTLAGRLVEALGTPVPGLGDLGLSHVFPSAQQVADAPLSKLAATGLTEQRAIAVRGLAAAYAGGRVALEPTMPLDDFVRALCELPGIGPWTAQFIALRAAGHLDAFPSDDLGLRRAFAERGEASDLAAHAERWRPYRAVAAMHLWGSLGAQAGRALKSA